MLGARRLTLRVVMAIGCCALGRPSTAAQQDESESRAFQDVVGGKAGQWEGGGGGASTLLKGVVASVVPVLQRSFAHANVSARCTGAFMDLSRRILSMDMAAWRFLDATGKFPSGILEGTLGDLGAYDECLASRLNGADGHDAPLKSLFVPSYRGQYCSVFLRPKETRAMDKLITQLTRYSVVKVSAEALFAAAASSVLAECILRTVPSSHFTRCCMNTLKAFSAVSNTESLLAKTPHEHECLKCLNGVRFFTALWVILGHSYNILDPHILGRGLGIFEMTNEFFFCIIANAYPSVETFFVIRLTTPSAFLLGLVYLLPAVVHGPAADQWLPGKVDSCYRSWPAVLLHYNNWLSHADIDVQMENESMENKSFCRGCRKMMQALDLIHQRPYPHVGSYVVGALAGFVFLRFRNWNINKVRGFLGNAVLSYLFGWAFYLACEKPFANLERSCFKRFLRGSDRGKPRGDECGSSSSLVVITANKKNEQLDGTAELKRPEQNLRRPTVRGTMGAAVLLRSSTCG
ncbi:hypothetical protein HPB48_000866 [Haemaphysalis longicornis]|uniref:Nose resistant-to-fluoxetine protein N-terminal domain-containing protein n=1 Tax=Haemaphysalis longicornis TaxID=44386 RepID=A0A9J6GS96_HAELO|nr:hypothetical protein HPB48_000866 [Haemaphysalis longicornis]